MVFLDGGLPAPVLQHEIIDLCGTLWRVDFARPEAMVAAEYDSMQMARQPRHLEARPAQGRAAGRVRLDGGLVRRR